MATIMGVAIFGNSVLGILSAFLIEDLGLTAAQIGWVAATISISGALLSPTAGRVADNIGGRRMAVAVLGVAGIGWLALAAAPTFSILLIAAVFAGLGQAGANPATNKMIGAHVPIRRQGIVTGIKQSGVQAALFVGGLVLPTLSLEWGWRTALASTIVVPILGVIVLLLIVPPDTIEMKLTGFRKRDAADPPRWINRVAWQGVLVGICVGAMVTYLPLYAQNELQFSVVSAGVLASAYAVAGLTTRLVSPPLAMRARHIAIPMMTLSFIASIGYLLLWLAPAWGSAALWIGAAMVGVLTGWLALGMLSVITRVKQSAAGNASGIVARGFTLGAAMGPVAFGLLLDWTGGYDLGLLLVGSCAGGSAVLMYRWFRSEYSLVPT